MESLDVFDTAIFRDVYEPKDIFKLIEAKVGNDFYKKRVDAESKVYNVMPFYTLTEIYRRMIGFDPQLEIKMEMEHTYANPEILEMYKKNPKNYVFISDMYLPSKVIKEILEKCGYENPRVFVSCEEKAKKGSGVLFKNVERKIGKITKHYGDNYRADIEGAAKANIPAVFLPSLQSRKQDLPAVKSPMLKKFAAELALNDDVPVVKLAKYYAPLIYDFTRWCIDKRRPDQHVYFVSRDMFMPYVIASQLMKEENVHYIHCSRKSLIPLIMTGKDAVLKNKIKNIFGEVTCKQKQLEGTRDALTYLRNTGIKNGDIIVDIGYSATTQRVIEQSLGIRLTGKYVQLGSVPKEYGAIDARQYLNRMALLYVFIAEFIFTSPEDNMDGYRSNGKPYFTPDNEQRKKYAKEIVEGIVTTEMYKKMKACNLTVFDVEQMLIFIQQNPSIDMLNILNEPILTNRRTKESCINCIREEILNGKLLECYKHSYAKPLFKKLLEHDSELASLVKLLPT